MPSDVNDESIVDVDILLLLLLAAAVAIAVVVVVDDEDDFQNMDLKNNDSIVFSHEAPNGSVNCNSRCVLIYVFISSHLARMPSPVLPAARPRCQHAHALLPDCLSHHL